jgi:hypothetical protein
LSLLFVTPLSLAGDTKSVAATSTTSPPAPEKSLALRLSPVNNSDQPVLANSSSIHLAPGMAYIDFGFIEPGVLAALPRMAKQGGKLPEEINGKLAVRVVMGFDGLANLQQQLTRVMAELAKAAKQTGERK